MKQVFDGEWVKVKNFMNRKFNAAGPCEHCRAMRCEMVWYSINSKKIRCLKCFTPSEWH